MRFYKNSINMRVIKIYMFTFIYIKYTHVLKVGDLWDNQNTIPKNKIIQ